MHRKICYKIIINYVQFMYNILNEIIVYTLLFLGDLTIHYDLYPILNMMNKYEEQMEQRTNFFFAIPYSNFLHGARKIKAEYIYAHNLYK